MAYRIVLFCCVCQLASFMAQAKQQVTLTFCYEDKQLLPYYTGEGHVAPNLPGVTIEHLHESEVCFKHASLFYANRSYRGV